VSIQAQVINSSSKRFRKNIVSPIFSYPIDLSVVSHISDTIAVMYLGRIVEIGPKMKIVEHHKHPYTRGVNLRLPFTHYEIKKERIILKETFPAPN